MIIHLTWLDHRNTNMIINVYMKLIVDAKGAMDGSLLGKAYRGMIDGGQKSGGNPCHQNLGKTTRPEMLLSSAPAAARTRNLRLRRPLLYPVELQAHASLYLFPPFLSTVRKLKRR